MSGANERFEILAAAFYDATGFLAPGKDVPMALASGSYEREQYAAWTIWNAGRNFGESRAGSPAPSPTGGNMNRELAEQAWGFAFAELVPERIMETPPPEWYALFGERAPAVPSPAPPSDPFRFHPAPGEWKAIEPGKDGWIGEDVLLQICPKCWEPLVVMAKRHGGYYCDLRKTHQCDRGAPSEAAIEGPWRIEEYNPYWRVVTAVPNSETIVGIGGDQRQAPELHEYLIRAEHAIAVRDALNRVSGGAPAKLEQEDLK